VYFEVFRTYCLARSAAGGTYATVGRSLRLTEAAVRRVLFQCRAVLRAIVRRRVSEYAGTEDEILAELGQILGEPVV
jgi:hypothetical protein